MSSARNESLLAEILIGVAWADGEITPFERTLLERWMGDLGLDAAERASLDAHLECPPGIDATLDAASKLLGRVGSDERERLLGRMEELIRADERVDERETAILAGFRTIGDGPGLVDRLRGFLFRARPAAEAGAGVRRIMGRLVPRQRDAARTAEARERVVLFGAVLYRVAFADGKVAPDEVEQLRALLSGTFGFEEVEIDEIIDVVRSRPADDMDRQRLCASFNRVATMDDRLRLLGCVFALAKADGGITDDEIREIRLIANYLWIDGREFNAVRLRHGSES